MKTIRITQAAAFAVLLSVLAGGCASEPDRIRREIREYTARNEFAKARDVKAKHNPGGIPKTEEERVKEELIRDEVNPAEIKYLSDRLSGQVEGCISGSRFDEARNAIWKPIPDLVPEVEKEVDGLKDRLLRERVNRTQFVQLTNAMAKSVSASVAKKDFDGARKYLDGIRPVRVWAKDVEQALADVRRALLNAKVPSAEAEKAVAAARPLLEEMFADNVLRSTRVLPGDLFKPNDKAYREKIKAFAETLDAQGVSRSELGKAVAAVDKVAAPALRALWQPQEAYELAPPLAIGTSKLNEMVAAEKTNLYENVVVPAQIACRAKELRNKVVPLVEAGRLDEARAAIHAYGVTGFPEVDDSVFAVKLGLLNARVNLVEWKTRTESLSGAVMKALADGDLEAASESIAAQRPVPAYGASVDKALRVAAAETAKLGVGAEDAGKVVEGTQDALYAAVAPRPVADREGSIMEAYLGEVAGIAAENATAEPDWSAVRKALDNAVAWLVADDMSKEEADAFMDEALSGFKTLAGGSADTGPSSLTTEELNRRLGELKADLSAKVAAGVAAKMAAADLVENATSFSEEELKRHLGLLRASAAEKVSPEFADRLAEETAAAAKARIAAAKAAEAAAAEKAAAAEAAAKAEAERLRKLALEMAERAAAEVDFDSRINAFVAAVSDRTEPDINRILGDGARVLRLRRAGASIGKTDATSLLAAAVYMGFDDVMNLAVVLGADADGWAAKDGLKRPVLLLALQYGFRGRAAAVLEKADRRARDARGDGALHYAVRGANGTALVELLRAGVSAKKTGKGGATPIVLAADLGYAGFVQALVPFSDLEKDDDEGFTALLRAAQNGRLDIVRQLVSAGADLSAKTAEGDGALELAAKANAPDLLAWLLDDKKVAPTARVVTQLVVAGDVPTLRLMVEHGAKLQDAHLAAAVKCGRFPMVKYLVNRGLDVNADVVKAVSADAGGTNDGSYYGPDGGTIFQFLHEQGQRP